MGVEDPVIIHNELAIPRTSVGPHHESWTKPTGYSFVFLVLQAEDRYGRTMLKIVHCTCTERDLGL